MANDLDKLKYSRRELRDYFTACASLSRVRVRMALWAVDAVQVQTFREIGRRIVEYEQCGAARAGYGTRLLPILAEALTQEFGRGFDATNLRHMWVFYQAFRIRDALRPELSWTHYRTLLKVKREVARSWYIGRGRRSGLDHLGAETTN